VKKEKVGKSSQLPVIRFAQHDCSKPQTDGETHFNVSQEKK
jgi:hypothetical protein